jgi:hypothetical protein
MGVLADGAQLITATWALLLLIPGGAMTLYAKYVDQLPWSVAVCVGLLVYASFVWLAKTASDRRHTIANATREHPASTLPLTSADERRLESAREEILRLAKAVKTIHARPHLSIALPGCKPISLSPPWEIETKQSLRAIVRVDIFEKYESVLKSKDPDNGAVAFLNALAKTLSLSHLA